MVDLNLSEILLNKLQQELTGYRVVQSLREGSTRTGVFKLESQGKFYYLKIFRRRTRFEPEVYAYQNWMPVIKPYCPELVTILDDRLSSTFGFVVTDLDGEVMKECDLTDAQKAVCYHKAGELTRSLHDSATGDYFGIPGLDGKPIGAHWKTAVEYYTEQLSGFTSVIRQMNRFDTTLKELYSWATENVDILSDEKAVPVSYDSTPGNWIVGVNGEFRGFIDFENMLWGINYDSLGVLIERYFFDSPNHAEHFFAGYGYNPMTDDSVKLKLALIKAGFASLMNGLKTNNRRWETLGTRMLEAIASRKFSIGVK